MTIYIAGAWGGITIFESSAALYLPYEFTSVPIDTGNTNAFGVDPERTTLIIINPTA